MTGETKAKGLARLVLDQHKEATALGCVFDSVILARLIVEWCEARRADEAAAMAVKHYGMIAERRIHEAARVRLAAAEAALAEAGEA